MYTTYAMQLVMYTALCWSLDAHLVTNSSYLNNLTIKEMKF